jgi:predicted metal-dependent HD superfamily phosphohydrolase
MLTDTFLQLINKYSKNTELATNLWLEIFTKYSEPKRQYHTIDHLEAIITDLNEVKGKIDDWDTTLFAVFYHDIIYKASSKTNEADSSKLAKKRLSEIDLSNDKIDKCLAMILATKQHLPSEDSDTNYLLDADLAILGKNPEDYQKYSNQIREEYTIYADFMYNSGRKKALQYFLEMEAIYKTEHFFKKYEEQARINIKNELDNLNH